MEVLGTVTAGLAGACVDERGRLIEHFLLDYASRAARIVDLVRLGKLDNDSDAIHVDAGPVGWAPLDDAARALAEQPMTLDSWIVSGSSGQLAVVEDLVSTGVWSQEVTPVRRQRRYETGRPRDQWGRTAERRLIRPLAPEPASERDAAVTLLASAAGLGDGDHDADTLLVRTGVARWVCELAWQMISQERAKNLDAFGTMRAGKITG
ncbi:GPP34 family phosphoprotein [Modestobacter sp. VKM Ac-2977]|uniref:GPP34 family phosphoprotein n=1 Tax=Modestobacter sp. VKM Ac-2977 TaxID=3004131 RepID=UPI0022AB13E0|nr:GPP34 family phosphoprotein [Modestobacter sp. VKM Ac-2977]MCZ2819227.1 GPP34 family phosphoprotein [Modestobacter sp. VKM Ac-2977]